MFAAGKEVPKKPLGYGGCFGLRALCEKHGAYSLYHSASAPTWAAFGSGIGGVRKFAQYGVKYGFQFALGQVARQFGSCCYSSGGSLVFI